jgi:hypothetical protein
MTDIKRGKLRITASSPERMAKLLNRLTEIAWDGRSDAAYCRATDSHLLSPNRWQRGARLLLRWYADGVWMDDYGVYAPMYHWAELYPKQIPSPGVPRERNDMDQEKIVWIAQACHEANRAWCLAHGDTSQPAWEVAPSWQRESAVSGVQGALNGNDPEASHENWMRQKIRDGWKYGPVKDPEKKEHPCLVAYSDLPPEQRAKDAIFVAVVRAFAEAFSAT